MNYYAYIHRIFTEEEAMIRACDIVSPCEIYRSATPQERDSGLTRMKVADGLNILTLRLERLGLWYDKETRLFRVTPDFVRELSK